MDVDDDTAEQRALRDARRLAKEAAIEREREKGYEAKLEALEHEAKVRRHKYPKPETAAARRILDYVMPATLELFLYKNKGYGDGADSLGARGQFADINRKYWKLRRALWEGEDLTGESLIEVCHDLVGHLWLTIDFLNQQENKHE